MVQVLRLVCQLEKCLVICGLSIVVVLLLVISEVEQRFIVVGICFGNQCLIMFGISVWMIVMLLLVSVVLVISVSLLFSFRCQRQVVVMVSSLQMMLWCLVSQCLSQGSNSVIRFMQSIGNIVSSDVFWKLRLVLVVIFLSSGLMLVRIGCRLMLRQKIISRLI